jgi:hypothetical protein
LSDNGCPASEYTYRCSIWFHLAGSNDFASYIDAIGELDAKPCLIDWKTTTNRLFGRAGQASAPRSITHLLFLTQGYAEYGLYQQANSFR